MNKNISVIGLGKLGSCMAGVYASKEYRVLGVDINDKFVEKINSGNAPVDEKDLQKYISENAALISASTSYEEAIQKSDITFVIVPTPTDETGGFSVEYVKSVCKQLAPELKKKDDYHLVVLTSTVLPGDSEKEIISLLEELSGKKCGKDFGYCYSPEFIAIGTVINDLLNPDFLLVGEFDKKSGDLLEEFYKTVTDNNAPVKRMSISSAELTKISVNSFLTMKITYANMLTEVAENIPNVNINDVTNAIGSDKRIGKAYLRGGLGYGGPCFPRDNRAFAVMAERRGVSAPYAAKTDEYNLYIIKRSIKKISELVSKDDSIGIIGLSYKPGTYFSEESQGLLIAEQLSKQGYKVNVINPSGNSHAEKLLSQTDVVFYKSIKDCVENSHAIFLTNFDKETHHLPELIKEGDSKIVIDPWRQFSSADFINKAKYIPFGECLL